MEFIYAKYDSELDVELFWPEEEFYTSVSIQSFIGRKLSLLPKEERNKAYLLVRVRTLDKEYPERSQKRYLLRSLVCPEGEHNEEEEVKEEQKNGWFRIRPDEYKKMNRKYVMTSYSKSLAIQREEERQASFEAEKHAKPLTLKERIKRFIDRKDSYKLFDQEVKERIVGQKNLSAVTYNVFLWLRGIVNEIECRNNTILVAPSGSGKTETYRVIQEILERDIGGIPVIQLDANMLTSEGFSGQDTSDFFAPLKKSEDGIAIVVLDEMDKKLIPTYDSGGSNVNAHIQAQLLTVIEGRDLADKNSKEIIANTNNTLFIAAGAFQGIRDSKTIRKKSIGFGNSVETTVEKAEDYDVTVDDILEAGALPELIGRFSTIINLNRLNRDSISIIVSRYINDFEKEMDCKITITQAAIDRLYDVYINSSFGCRVLKSKMLERLSTVGIEIERECQGVPRSDIVIKYDANKVSYRIKKHRAM